VALAAWVRVRASGGAFVLRVEDLDSQRTVPGAVERILADLAWLGLDWDEGPDTGGPFAPYVQSERLALYEDALRRLSRRDLVYPCTCSRTEIARIASAPHVGEEGPVYPGLCRDPAHRRTDRKPASRLRIPDDDSRTVRFVDLVCGPQEQDVLAAVGDFVLRRADGQFSYQLAVTVDDLAMGITEVVRGDDLLSSTARQILLARLLGCSPPAYLHVPVVLGPDGERLAKRHQTRWHGSTVAELREAGIRPEQVLGALGAALGLLEPEISDPGARTGAGRVEATPAELVDAMGRGALKPVSSWTAPADWVRPRQGS